MSEYRFEIEADHLALVSDTHLEWGEVEVVSFPSESEIVVRVTLCDSADSNLFKFEVDGAEDIRADMKEWLEESGYSVSIPCDFASKESCATAILEAMAVRGRFNGGDYTPLDAVYKVMWSSDNRLGEFEGLEYRTLEAAVNSLPDFTADLLDQVGADDAERRSILAGTFEIYRGRGSWTRGWQSLSETETFDVADFAPLHAAA